MPQDEFDWINKHRPSVQFQKDLIEGIGDDTAVYSPVSNYDELLCVDTLIEDVHFKKETMAPIDIGHKALAVNISDIAAMGGIPVYYMISIAIPTTWSDKELEGIYTGITKLANRYKMDMIGGDTVSSPSGLMISVTVSGRIEKGRSLLRRNAKPGDIIFVTNPTGRSAAGLSLLLNKGRVADFNDQEKSLINYHQQPEPRVKEGRIIANLNIRAAVNDVSDGLASEIFELAEASGTAMELWENKIPVAQEFELYSEKQYWDWIFYGGEDFELVGSVREKDWPLLKETMEREGCHVHDIGTVKRGQPSVTVLGRDGETTLEKKGYNHFKQ